VASCSLIKMYLRFTGTRWGRNEDFLQIKRHHILQDSNVHAFNTDLRVLAAGYYLTQTHIHAPCPVTLLLVQPIMNLLTK
jgi:hypothetical protein